MPTAFNSQLLAATNRNFHEIVQQLFLKTPKPMRPQNYRRYIFQQSESYLPLHITVLTQDKEGAASVSAAMIEECNSRGSLSLTIRIVSSETPLLETVDRLRRCLDMVEEAACVETDEYKDIQKSNLLVQIIKLDKGLLQSRTGLQKNRGGKVGPSMFDRVESLRCKLFVSRGNTEDSSLRSSLCINLSELCQEIKTLTLSFEDGQTDCLTAIVPAAHKVSSVANNPPLGHQLQKKCINLDLSHRRTVTQIGKISRYLDSSNGLIDISRKTGYDGLFRNIRLELCTAPKAQYQNGHILHAHSQIQLISFHDQHPAGSPPRCIGSSKSACFLCDLFIKKYGSHRISHLHGRLYLKWTVPEGHYANEEINVRLSETLKDMSQEMLQIKRTFVR